MKIGLTVHVVTENHTWPAHRKISIKSKPACLGKISGNNNSRMHNCLAKQIYLVSPSSLIPTGVSFCSLPNATSSMLWPCRLYLPPDAKNPGQGL